MALCRGAEGDGSAVQWLRNHDQPVLALMALGADNDDDAMCEHCSKSMTAFGVPLH